MWWDEEEGGGELTMQAPLAMRARSILMRASLDLLGGMCINLFVHVAIRNQSSLP